MWTETSGFHKRQGISCVVECTNRFSRTLLHGVSYFNCLWQSHLINLLAWPLATNQNSCWLASRDVSKLPPEYEAKMFSIHPVATFGNSHKITDRNNKGKKSEIHKRINKIKQRE
jgi:hypothetical protein